MIFKQKCIYFISALSLFLLLALFEFFILDDFVVLISDRWSVRTLCFLIMLLIFNPYIVYRLMELIPFQVKGLKVEAGLKESLKQENGYKRS